MTPSFELVIRTVTSSMTTLTMSSRFAEASRFLFLLSGSTIRFDEDFTLRE